jgi:phosphoribosylformylglycinamidine (FGAM) synthase-like amidotransferase family enzyme
LDESNNEQLPRLLHFWKTRFPKYNIDEPIQAVATKIEQKMSEAKRNRKQPVKICDSILNDGECLSIAKGCQLRHQFYPEDLICPTYLRSSVHIRYQILQINSPSDFYVRLTGYRNSAKDEWTIVHNRNQFLNRLMQMNMYFKDEDVHVSHGKPNLNDYCVVKYGEQYERAVVRDLNVKNENNGHVNVLLIDNGKDIFVSEASLLHLPEQFLEIESNAFELRIAGLKATDYDTEWDPKSRDTVRKWLKNYEENTKCHIESQILAAANGRLWVDTVTVIEFLNSAKTNLKYVDIRKETVAHKFGVDDDGSMNKVVKNIEKLIEDCRSHTKKELVTIKEVVEGMYIRVFSLFVKITKFNHAVFSVHKFGRQQHRSRQHSLRTSSQ